MIPLCEDAATTAEVGPPIDVCEVCVQIGSTWVHLRQCLACGTTRCCDNSPNRHATAHYQADGHAMIRSAQPSEDWRWCYKDELLFVPGLDGYEVAED